MCFKSPEEMKLIFEKKNLMDKKDIVFYCGQGVTACCLYIGSELIGLNNN
jgi:3-mercaptopyruvate sulfurtransferase SseA